MPDTFDRLKAALADRYAIERELGSGGMATVYLAEDLKHRRKVAVKVLRPELAAVLGAERFVQEITTTANLQHPHILPLFDSGEADSFLYYVMPFIDGETLRDKLNREKQLGIEEAVKITTEVADALDYAHRQNVIHRDIKPENILLHDGRPMVADFGIALAVSTAAGNRMTETGLSLGTPHYMSPEQATADKDITNRSDIYSLGAVLYEMLTGEPPHTGSSAQQIIMRIVTDDVRPITEIRKTVPPNVAAATVKAVAKLPADRFGAANEFGAALSDTMFRDVIAEPRATSITGSRREVVAWIAAAAFGLLFFWSVAQQSTPDSVDRPVTRFTLPVGEGHTMMWETRPQLAVSPDGRTIAYVSNRKLFVRRLDDGAPTVIYEGEPLAPAFSPDGLALLFWEQNALKRVSTDGGAATDISGASSFGTSVHWGTDGIYYSKVDGIYRTSERGGDQTRLTTLAENSEAQHQWPQLIEEDLLMYTVAGPSLGWDDSKLVMHDLATNSRVWELEGAMYGWYVSTGHVLYSRGDGTVLAVPFDLSSRTPSEAPIPVLQGVRVSEDLGGASFSVSEGGTLVYATSQAGGSHVLQRRNRSGELVRQIGDPASWDQPHLSADGSRIAVVIRKPSNDDVWFVDLSNGGAERYTFDLREDETPVWSPDNTELVFTAYGGRQRHVYRQRVDVGNPELIYVSDFHMHVTSWSPDGRWLLTYFTDSVTRDDIWALELGDSVIATPIVNSPAAEAVPSFSPGGQWIAYQSDENGDWDVFVQPWPLRPDKHQVSSNGGTWPVWSADGRSLFFFKPDGDQALVMEAQLQVAPRFARTSLDTLFTVPAKDAQRAMQVLPNGDFLILAYNPEAIEYDIKVVENFFEELTLRVGN